VRANSYPELKFPDIAKYPLEIGAPFMSLECIAMRDSSPMRIAIAVWRALRLVLRPFLRRVAISAGNQIPVSVYF
jgi:hypothetical protein